MKNPALRIISGIGSVLLVLLGGGCGPTVKRAALPEGVNIQRTALLPLSVPPQMTEARKNILRVSLRAELESKGYSLLDEAKTAAECAQGGCSDPQMLIQKYGLDGVFRVEVSAADESDFGLGYYNSLKGRVSLVGKEKNEIVSVEYTESEGGGLLLDSGQVFQAVKEQLASSADETFEVLAANFSDRVVRELPAPLTAQALAAQPQTPGVSLQDVSIEEKKPGVYEVCAIVEGDAVAYIVSGRRRSNLRKVADNRYCSRFRNTIAFEGPFVEVRSSFGDQGRKALALPAARSCALSEAATASLSKHTLEVNFRCPEFGKIYANSCGAEDKGRCRASKILVFSSEKIPGPVTRLAALTTPTYRSALKGKLPNYIHLVALYEDGTSSAPYTLAREKIQR